MSGDDKTIATLFTKIYKPTIMKIRSIYFLATLIITMCLPIFSIAQGGGLPPEPADVPIDGGLSLLLAAGVGYGVKKYRDSKRKGSD